VLYVVCDDSAWNCPPTTAFLVSATERTVFGPPYWAKGQEPAEDTGCPSPVHSADLQLKPFWISFSPLAGRAWRHHTVQCHP
jgi:hypothetical protein